MECVHEVGVDVLDGGEAVHGDGPNALEEVEEMEGVGFGGGHEEGWVGGGGGELSLVRVGVFVVVGGGGGGGRGEGTVEEGSRSGRRKSQRGSERKSSMGRRKR
ncbi:hypothetical protein QJS04_geneDACA013583 [Acorus gramineus]|uniref:Uncharacterized protein n=1 Tax=Acorus gramineus TaxID=55184 RepID=A0AAV9AHF4_ACOGR|nr:hypothetical protein QJS04_geneDACA013583 [Acorus gramineus]